jgi:hypothetical protein
MTIKPFAIQGADLTLGGVNLQAGTTGVVIPGVTQATSYKVEEVNDTGDQTYSNFPLDTEGEVVVIDAALYDTIVAQGDERHFADYTVTTDGEGYIDEIQVNGQGAYTGILTGQAQSFDMYAYIGAGSASDRPLVPQDWIQIPFRPKMRAGEIETIGGGSGGGVVERSVNYPLGESGDTAGTLALTPYGYTYICTRDFIEPQSETITAWHTTANIGQTPPDSGYQAFTVDFSDPRNSDLYDFLVDPPPNFGGYPEFSFNDGETWVTAHSYGGTYPGENSYAAYTFAGSALSDNYEVLVRYSTFEYNIWRQTDLGDLQVAGQWINTPKYQGGEGSVQLEHDNVDLWVENDDNSLAELWLHNEDTSAPHADIIVAAANDNDPTAEKTWMFQADGSLKFPDGTLQTTAYTGQSGGGSGELYIMANVDGNIITSTDGQTWGEPVPSGVPTFDGGPMTTAIGKLDIHGGVIVYTRCEVGDISGSGLYYSTEIGTATLCEGTDSSPGGDLYWNEVRFFHETDKWVAVGYASSDGEQKYPIIAYSTDGISWGVTFVDSSFVADHNAGNWPWEMTDVAYNPTDAKYVFVGRVGGDNHAGAFVTNDLTVNFDANIWIDVPLNAKFIQNWPVAQFGGPPGYMIVISNAVNDAWNVTSPITDSNNWDPNFIGPNDGWYQDAMIDAVGYVPVITEMTSNGSTVIIVTEDGQVAVPNPGGMTVTVPVPYTATITDIIRNNSTTGITRFTTVPAVNDTNMNWQDFDLDINFGAGTTVFHVTIVSGVLTACTLVSSTDLWAINDSLPISGETFGGTSPADDIVVTVTGVPATTIQFTNIGNGGIANDNGEKIVITGVTSADASEPNTSNQSYNGTYYVKKIFNGGGPDTYELYTNQTCTTPWNTSTYWPVTDPTNGTLTWSHGQYFDAAGCANSYFYIGNDDEKIFRSIDNGTTWVEQADLTGEWLNDFAYGTWGSGASSLTELTVESPFVVDLFGPKVYFDKSNYGSEVDNIDTNVAITRGDNQGPYNPITDDNWNDNTSGPTNTEWNMDGWGDLSNVTDRNYDTWENIAHGARTPGRELVMHDTENNKYYAIMFHSFQGGEQGGAFSYTRKLINTACWFTRADDDSSGYGDEIDTGIKIVRGSSEGIYNTLDEGGWNDNNSPTGTLWNAQGWSDLTDVTTRQYLNFDAACKSRVGKNVCGVESVSYTHLTLPTSP